MFQAPITRTLGESQVSPLPTSMFDELPDLAAASPARLRLERLVSATLSHYESRPMPMRLRHVLREIERLQQTEIRCTAATYHLCQLLLRYHAEASPLLSAVLAAQHALAETAAA